MASTKLRIQQEYFDYIRKGTKTVEGRIAYPSLKTVNVGDTILFECSTESLSCRVVAIFNYESFQEMLEARGIQNCLPGVTDIAAAVKIYLSFPRYADLEKIYGVIAFTIELLN